jgi:hypothetical protein
LFKLGNSPHSGVQVSKQKGYGFSGGGTYEFDHFLIYIDHMPANAYGVKIELRDQHHTYVLCDVMIGEDSVITFEEEYWKHAFMHCINEAKEKVEEAVRQQYQNEILHFTKKYRLKSF